VTARRALFLSGSFGKGHDTLAEACAGALVPYGVESSIVDCMPMLGRGPGAVGDWIFRRLLSITPVYDAFHFSQLRGEGVLGRFADRASAGVMYPHLRAEVERFRPDLLVSVFATGAAAAVRLKSEYPDVAHVVFITDAFAHRVWVHEGTDLFLVTSEVAAASVRRYWARARVEVVNAPVRPSFYQPPTKAAARSALGVPAEAPCVLLMAGAWGMGPLDEVARALSRAGYWVLAVGGTNGRMVGRLRAVADEEATVVPFAYTDRVAELMSASDVIVTSAGDTCREARVIGRGLVLLDVVPGHGRENLMHELELGNASACSATAGAVLGAVEAFFGQRHREPDAPLWSASAWDAEFVEALSRAGVELAPVTEAP
jgi:UDP-N-acetylglucosamine:LPS N-acetylglucosamine transferase